MYVTEYAVLPLRRDLLDLDSPIGGRRFHSRLKKAPLSSIITIKLEE